jgi:hypothetical protein
MATGSPLREKKQIGFSTVAVMCVVLWMHVGTSDDLPVSRVRLPEHERSIRLCGRFWVRPVE